MRLTAVFLIILALTLKISSGQDRSISIERLSNSEFKNRLDELAEQHGNQKSVLDTLSLDAMFRVLGIKFGVISCLDFNIGISSNAKLCIQGVMNRDSVFFKNSIIYAVKYINANDQKCFVHKDGSNVVVFYSIQYTEGNKEFGYFEMKKYYVMKFESTP